MKTINELAAEILDLAEEASISVELNGDYDSHFEIINSLKDVAISLAEQLIFSKMFVEESTLIIDLSIQADLSVQEYEDYDENMEILNKLESEAVSLAYKVLA